MIFLRDHTKRGFDDGGAGTGFSYFLSVLVIHPCERIGSARRDTYRETSQRKGKTAAMKATVVFNFMINYPFIQECIDRERVKWIDSWRLR